MVHSTIAKHITGRGGCSPQTSSGKRVHVQIRVNENRLVYMPSRKQTRSHGSITRGTWGIVIRPHAHTHTHTSQGISEYGRFPKSFILQISYNFRGCSCMMNPICMKLLICSSCYQYVRGRACSALTVFRWRHESAGERGSDCACHRQPHQRESLKLSVNVVDQSTAIAEDAAASWGETPLPQSNDCPGII